MSMWLALLIAAGLAFALKLVGYLVPSNLLAEPHVKRVTAALPIALLAALVAIQTLTRSGGGALTVDARLAAVAVAVVALLLRAPFIVVVVLGALTAAALRAAGLG